MYVYVYMYMYMYMHAICRGNLPHALVSDVLKLLLSNVVHVHVHTLSL